MSREMSGMDKRTDKCFQLPKKRARFSTFPPLTLDFKDGRTLELPARNYMFMHERRDSVFCVGIYPEDREQGAIIGSILLRDIFLHIDAATWRIGLGRASCSNLIPSL